MLFRIDIRKYLLFFCVVGIVLPHSLSAKTAKNIYFEAEACYGKILNNPQRQIYRENWLRCIEKFQAVYRQDPSGPWAAAGLFMSGKLYQELYRYSYKEADRDEAIDFFERIIKRYPKSKYSHRAQKSIGAFTKTKKKKPASKSSNSMRDKYNRAYACYKNVINNPKKQKYRDNWLRCIKKFQDVYRDNPSGPWATAGLFMSGKLYMELYGHSYRKGDKEEAIDFFERIIAHYPKSKYSQKAEREIGLLTQSRLGKKVPGKKIYQKKDKRNDQIKKEIAGKKHTPVKGRVGKSVELPEKDKTSVTGLRYWSNPSYTRIVIDTNDRETSYSHRLLKKDPSIHKPQRLYVDISGSRLGKDIKRIIPIHDDLLADARAGQYTPDVVRIVVDIKSFKHYKIFSLINPFRIVIDVWGRETKKAQVKQTPKKPSKGGKKLTPGALAKQLALGVKRIVIDPGHGGRDFGAPGYLKGVHEKDITLRIAKRLAKKIRQKLGCEVILTRKTDRYLTLEERTAIANTKNADLFISIHTNAAKDRRAYGIMTFMLNLATDDESIMIAARENATSTKNISDLQTILSDLMQNAKINESSRLAGFIQRSLYGHLKKKYSRIKDKGVKQAPFYVLMGAQMPAVLIETSFISNSRDCRRLVNKNYQDRMADAIVNGIRAYIKEINPTASIKARPGNANS